MRTRAVADSLKLRRFVLRLSIGLLPTLWPASSSTGGQVELTLAGGLGIERKGAPVTSGVPIPKGELKSAANVRLLCDGVEAPAQFRATGLWRPGDSIRWLLVDFQADIEAGKKRTYTLEYGPGVKQAAQPKAPVRLQEDRTGYTVRTGAATFRISKERFSLFERVELANGAVLVSPPGEKPRFAGAVRGLRRMVTRPIPSPKNTGRSHLIFVESLADAATEDYTLRFITDSEYEVVGAKSGKAGRGAYLKDFKSTDNRVAIPASAWLRYRRPKKGDRYTFRAIPAGSKALGEGVFETKVVESGPMRSVIRVTGSFGPTAAPALEYTAWYHFFAGSGAVKLAFTLENNNHGGRTNTGNARNANIGGVNCVFFDEMTLSLPVILSGRKSAYLHADITLPPMDYALDREIELYQDSGGGRYWDRYKQPKFHPRANSYVSFKGFRIFTGDRPSGEGGRAVGWLSAFGEAGGVTVAVRDFWQNFPKSLAASPDGTLTVGLFPGRYAGDFPFRSGEHKTHEILLAFHAGHPSKSGAVGAAVTFSRPLRAEPSSEWFAKTRALGRLHPQDMTHYRAYEVRNLSTVGVFPEGVKKGPSLPGQIEKFNMLGWMDYGDVPIDFEAASGQWGMKYDLDYHMAQQYARTLHPNWFRLFTAADRHTRDIDIHHQPHHPEPHYVNGGVWAHSLHNEPGHKNPHRNYNHFTKDLCFGARGTAALYYLTGDWKAYQSCLEIATNALARYMSPQSEPDPKQRNRMGWRGDACSLNRLLEGYLLTGGGDFLRRARWVVKDCAFDGRPARHKQTSLWSSVFYMTALARYVEMFPDDAAAKGYLLAHLRTLRKSVTPDSGIYYRITPQPDGDVVGSGQCSHYNIMASDALAVGYLLTGDAKYIEAARRCFAYGVKNACWKGGPPTYFHVHSANGSLHGNVFMAVDSQLRGAGGR